MQCKKLFTKTTLYQVENYRKDIDGLRAISVLLVIFYHLRIFFVSSGFVGVDVFFVISGYLITKHIFSEYSENRFSLKRFYLHRIRRILPALIVMIFFITIVVFFLFLPNSIMEYLKSALATLTFVANIYFYKTIHLGYFSTEAKVFPLLHTWTLGVEEQFYIVWPLVSLLMLRWLPKRWVFVFTLLFLICSFFIYYVYHFHHKLAVFYLPITRGFELLIGALLAISLESVEIRKKNSLWVIHLLSYIGLILIIYSSCFIRQSYYPGSAILLPCIGAALLIYTGKYSGHANRVLSLSPIAFIGLISYSLYLWHWPLIAFLNYFNIALTYKVDIIIICLSFIISVITWKFVEQPFRYKFTFGIFRSLFFFILIPIILVATLFMLYKVYPALGYNQISTNIYQITNDYYGKEDTKKCSEDSGATTPLPPKYCSIGYTKNKTISALIIGDSHAMAAKGMLSVLLKNAHLKGYLVTQSGTPFILGNIKNWRKNKPMLRNTYVKHLIAKNHYKYVILAGFWNYYPDWSITGDMRKKGSGSYTVFGYGLKNSIKYILTQGSIPVILLDTPPLLNISIYCGFTRLSKFNKCYNDERQIKLIQSTTKSIILSLKKQYPSIILINLNNVICKNSKCYSSISGFPLYYTAGQNSHLNYPGSKLIGKLYLKYNKNPFF